MRIGIFLLPFLPDHKMQPMPTQAQQRLLSRADYHRMGEAGILLSGERTELLNGKIYTMSPIGSRHAACVEKMDELLKALLKGKASVRSQNPIALSEHSEPEPDIALVQFREDYYAERHPLPSEVFLIIEAAYSSTLSDRQEKLPLYAAAGIPECWIIDLDKMQIEVYTKPTKGQYRNKQLYFSGDTIAVPQLGIDLNVEQLLP